MATAAQALKDSRLRAAFEKVLKNSNAAGVDGITPEDFSHSLAINLRALKTEVLAEGYRCLPLRRAWLRNGFVYTP
jgi:retron-type reverse transcriptase